MAIGKGGRKRPRNHRQRFSAQKAEASPITVHHLSDAELAERRAARSYIRPVAPQPVQWQPYAARRKTICGSCTATILAGDKAYFQPHDPMKPPRCEMCAGTQTTSTIQVVNTA